MAQAEEGQQGALNADVELRRLAVRERRLLYRPMRGLGLEGPITFALCCLGVLAAVVAVNDGQSEFFPDLVAWGTGAVYAAYEWLWCSCRWVRVDAETLEWKTPLTRGRVPLHEVRGISLDNPRKASIDIRGTVPSTCPCGTASKT